MEDIQRVDVLQVEGGEEPVLQGDLQGGDMRTAFWLTEYGQRPTWL